MKKVNVAVVGATGMVGRTFLKVLEERQFPIENVYFFSSKKSAGSTITFAGKDYVVEELTETAFDGKNFYFKKAKKTNIINVTGAGDAFNSGFLAYYMKYASINKALEGGILNSAAVISQIGAQKGLFKIN